MLPRPSLSPGPSQRPKRSSRASSQTEAARRPTPVLSAGFKKRQRVGKHLGPYQGGTRLPAGMQSHDLGLFLANHWLPSQSPGRQQAQASIRPACHFLTLHVEIPRDYGVAGGQGLRTKPSQLSSERCLPAPLAWPGPWLQLSGVLATAEGSSSKPHQEYSLCTLPWTTCLPLIFSHLTLKTPSGAGGGGLAPF